MKHPFLASAVAILAISTLSGCLSRGKAKEAHVSFGIPSIFQITKDETGISMTDAGVLKAADSATKVSILLFTWESRGKDVEVKFTPSAPVVAKP